jgi:aspartate dehydrogenase
MYEANLPSMTSQKSHQIVRPGQESASTLPCISDLRDLPESPDLIIDCAGHAALAANGQQPWS